MAPLCDVRLFSCVHGTWRVGGIPNVVKVSVGARWIARVVATQVSGYGKNAHYFIVRTLTKLVGIDINTDGTRCHRVIYVLEQARFIVSHEGRNLPILITS